MQPLYRFSASRARSQAGKSQNSFRWRTATQNALAPRLTRGMMENFPGRISSDTMGLSNFVSCSFLGPGIVNHPILPAGDAAEQLRKQAPATNAIYIWCLRHFGHHPHTSSAARRSEACNVRSKRSYMRSLDILHKIG